MGVAGPGRFTLIVAIGRRQDGHTTSGTVGIELRAGGVVIASTVLEDPAAAIAPDSWFDLVAVGSVGPGDLALGAALEVRLTMTGSPQAQFDDVRLRYAPLQPLTVPNASFENPVVPPWTFTTANNWQTSGPANSGGVSAGTIGFDAALDGDQYLFLNLAGFSGVSPHLATSVPFTIGAVHPGMYHLTVAVGRRTNANGATDGLIEVDLVADGTVIAHAEVQNPRDTYAPGTWNDLTASGVVEPGSPLVGEDLTVRLTADEDTSSTQAQFDLVRLRWVSYGPAP